MTKNLQIYLLNQQIMDLLNKSDLEVGIIVLLLKNLTMQIENSFNEQINIDYKNYFKELESNNKEENTVTKEIHIPLDDLVGQE